MKLILAIIFSITSALAYAKPSNDLSSIQKLHLIQHFKDLDGILALLQTRYSKEELNYLRNKLIAAGFKPAEPFEIKINEKSKSFTVAKLEEKVFVFSKDGEISVDGLVFRLDPSLPLDKNAEKFEKLFENKGYGKFEIGISKAQAQDLAKHLIVDGSSVVVALALAAVGFTFLPTLILSSAFFVYASQLADENPGLTVPEKIKLTSQDISDALSNLDNIKCDRMKSVTIALKDQSKIAITLDRQNVVSGVKLLSSAGVATTKVYFPQSERETMGRVFALYCANKPAKDTHEFAKVLEELKMSFKTATLPLPDASSTK